MADPLKSGYLMSQETTAEQVRQNDDVLADLETVLESRQGRRFVWRLLEKSNLKQNAMTGNSQTFFILGQQSVSNELMGILFSERFLSKFRLMQDEAISDEKMRRETRKKELKDV